MNAAIREFNKLLSLVKDKPDLVPYLAEVGSLREQEMYKFNASSHVPIFHPVHFVIFFLVESIPPQDYRERCRKGRAPYVHTNIEPESCHKFLFTDRASIQSIGTIVQHTARSPNMELHMKTARP